jgi:hypothetical protein
MREKKKVIETISIKGLRKSHLVQLVSYIHMRDRDGWYYGSKKQFEARHRDLLMLVEELQLIIVDPQVRIGR